MRVLGVLSIVVFAASVSPSAQGALSADEKELAAYKLTMPTLNKVAAAMRAMAEEAKQDPKYQRVMKLNAQIADTEAQIEKLSEKEQLTSAEETKLEGLNEQLDKLRAQKEQLEEETEKDNPARNPKTLTEMEQSIKQVPLFARALERAGLTPREYSKFMLAMLQAGMVHGFSGGKVDYAKLPPGINPDNVRFIEEHKAELDAMQKEFAALEKGKR